MAAVSQFTASTAHTEIAACPAAKVAVAVLLPLPAAPIIR